GREQQVLAAGELAVDGLHRVRRLRDEEVGQRDRAARRRPRLPRGAGGVRGRGGNTHVVTALAVEEQVRLLAAHRRRVERRVRGGRGRGVRGGARDAGEGG